MKRILIVFSLLLGIFCSVSNVSYAANNLSAFGVVFENSDEIPAFKSVAIKNLTKSETFVHDRHKFLGVRKLIDILGEVKSEDRRVIFTTNYMRISDDETVSLVDKATWYYFLSKKGKPIYALYYPTNDVTKIMTEGDLLIIGKVSDTEIYVILLAKDSKKRSGFLKQFDGFDYETPNEKNTVWTKLWTKSYKTEQKADDKQEGLRNIKAKDWVRIYFTPGPDCENNIIAEINKAKKMDIAVYSITNQKIVDAILAAKDRGAKIRIITDRLMAKNKSSLVEELSDAGIPVLTNVKHKIEHNKFAVFGGRVVVTGSYNWTNNATKSNSENCLFFEQPNKEYSERFEYLWDLYSKS